VIKNVFLELKKSMLANKSLKLTLDAGRKSKHRFIRRSLAPSR
jgi:hypothetical protein